MLTLGFQDFWKDSDWDPYHNIFTDSLDQGGLAYHVDSKKPDVLVFCHCGDQHKSYSSSVKILFATDCSTTTFMGNKCHTAYHTETCLAGKLPDKISDGVIGYEHLNNEKYVRLPWYVSHDWFITRRFRISPPKTGTKRKFACFLFQNTRRERLRFLESLSKYKPIDVKQNKYNQHIVLPLKMKFVSEEKWDQNWIIEKCDFIRSYKFNIGFENIVYPGYVTEKLFHAFYNKCIPIYYGHPDVIKDFRKEFFVFVQDYPSFEAVVDRVREIDSNESLYNQMLPHGGEQQLRSLRSFQESIYEFFRRL